MRGTNKRFPLEDVKPQRGTDVIINNLLEEQVK